MQAIEFNAAIYNGTIVLPLKYRQMNVKHSRIIVLIDEDAEQKERTERKQRLLATIKKIQEINPFRNITDAVEWQKQQRDEWERSFD